MIRLIWYPFLCSEGGEALSPVLHDGPMFYADVTLGEEAIVDGIRASLGEDTFLVPLRRLLTANPRVLQAQRQR